MSMDTFIMPGKIIYGSDCIEPAMADIGRSLHHPLIVTDDNMVKFGNVAHVTGILDKLKISYSIYSGVNSEPSDAMVEEGLAVYEREHCDCVIGLGGGSPLDTAKVIAVQAGSDEPIAALQHRVIDHARPKLIAIPTTAGTGSEATQFAIITDLKRQIKMLLKGHALLPDIAIIDPVFTFSAPCQVTVNTGVDALCHAIEAFTSKKSQHLSDTFALSAMVNIINYLPKAAADGKDIKARLKMSLAATQAGIAFNNSSVTVVHGMSRPIGALFHVPHGLSNAVLLAGCLKHICEAASPRLAILNRICGWSDEGMDELDEAKCFVTMIDALLKDLKVPKLRELKIDEQAFMDNLDKMAFDAIDSGSPANTLMAFDQNDVKELYRTIWNA